MIYSYLDYLKDRYEYSKKGDVKDIKLEKHKLPQEIKNFYSRRGECPLCKIHAKLVFDKSDSMTMSKDYFTLKRIWECPKCGWWESFEDSIEEYDYITKVDSYHIEELNYAILKKFDEKDKDLPLDVLLEELKKNQDILYDIHFYKMEKLVQHVFTQYFNCEVKHVGKTADGGKDLIIVQKDEPILVQVKRRTKKDGTESVSTVRDLLGTMFIENKRKGIIVSTADHFTKPSIKVRDDLINEKRLDMFELYDIERFCSMLDLYNKTDEKTWHKIASKW